MRRSHAADPHQARTAEAAAAATVLTADAWADAAAVALPPAADAAAEAAQPVRQTPLSRTTAQLSSAEQQTKEGIQKAVQR